MRGYRYGTSKLLPIRPAVPVRRPYEPAPEEVRVHIEALDRGLRREVLAGRLPPVQQRIAWTGRVGTMSTTYEAEYWLEPDGWRCVKAEVITME